MASLSQGRTAAAQCSLFTHKSVLVIFEPPCINQHVSNYPASRMIVLLRLKYAATITCMCYIQFNTTVVLFDTNQRLEHHFQVQSTIVCYC